MIKTNCLIFIKTGITAGITVLLNFLILCVFLNDKREFYNEFTTFERCFDMIFDRVKQVFKAQLYLYYAVYNMRQYFVKYYRILYFNAKLFFENTNEDSNI